MGAGNVKLVYARWSHLPDGAFRLLVYMALTSKDDEDLPAFWGGRDALSVAMGRLLQDGGDEREQELAFKSVNRLIATLKKAGAISQAVPAAPGRNATYSLNLRAQRSPASGGRPRPKRSPASGGHRPYVENDNDPHSVDVTVPTQWVERSPLSGRTVPTEWGPEEVEEELRTKPKEQKGDVSTTSHPPRVPEHDNVVPFIPPKPKTPDPITARVRGRAAYASQQIAEAQARRRAAEATYRAEQETS